MYFTRRGEQVKKTAHVCGLTLVVMALLLVLGASCGEQPQVSGQEVVYSFSVQGVVDNGSPTQFTNKAGWQIELSRAQALIGPVYFYSGEARASLMDRLIGINQAYACAAHSQFQSGRTLGEQTLQYGVDLLAGPTMLAGEGVGESGEVRSVELHVQNPGQVEAGNALAASLASTYEFEGVATRGEDRVPFTIAMTLPEEGTYQIVDSIPARMQLDEGSALLLEMRLDRLFRDVDFEDLVEQVDGDEPVAIVPGSQAYTSLTFSLRSRDAFHWENRP